MTPRLSLSSKIIFTKNKSTTNRRCLESLLDGIPPQRNSETLPIKVSKFETELCVTLSTLDSFESEGFEPVSNLAIRFRVRPSAAAIFFFFLRRGKCVESASTAP